MAGPMDLYSLVNGQGPLQAGVSSQIMPMLQQQSALQSLYNQPIQQDLENQYKGAQVNQANSLANMYQSDTTAKDLANQITQGTMDTTIGSKNDQNTAVSSKSRAQMMNDAGQEMQAFGQYLGGLPEEQRIPAFQQILSKFPQLADNPVAQNLLNEDPKMLPLRMQGYGLSVAQSSQDFQNRAELQARQQQNEKDINNTNIQARLNDIAAQGQNSQTIEQMRIDAGKYLSKQQNKQSISYILSSNQSPGNKAASIKGIAFMEQDPNEKAVLLSLAQDLETQQLHANAAGRTPTMTYDAQGNQQTNVPMGYTNQGNSNPSVSGAGPNISQSAYQSLPKGASYWWNGKQMTKQ